MATKWINKFPRADESDDDEHSNDVYREENHVYFYTDIDRTTISKLNILLREAEEYCVVMGLRLRLDTIPIYLHIYSNGGYIYSAFSAIDLIESLKVPVYSVIEGATASAGTLISIVCTKRFIRPLGYMLIHQLSGGYWGKYEEMEEDLDNSRKFMEKI